MIILDIFYIISITETFQLIIPSVLIYWSNVLTERFFIPYKNQTKEDTSF